VFRSLEDEVTHEVPTLAVTTRAMRGNAQAEKDKEGHEEYSSDEGPSLLDLDRVVRVARKTYRELETENMILQDRERPNIIYNLEDSEMGEWEKPNIPIDEFDGVGVTKVEKPNGYDL
jgi:hypothetical protein